MRTRLLVPVLAVLAMSSTGCSSDEPSADPTTEGASPTRTAKPAEPCELTAVVEGVEYHARGIYGDYEVEPTRVEGTLTPCEGVEGTPTTFGLVAGVKQEWALVAEHQEQVVFFVTDDLPPIPADSEFARILVGDFAD